MNAVDRAAIHMMCAKEFAKNRIREELFGDERGAFGIIEIIIIIAIVLVIAFFFRDQITEFVKNLWSKNIDGNTEDVTKMSK